MRCRNDLGAKSVCRKLGNSAKVGVMDNQQQIKIRIGLVCVAFLIVTIVLTMLFGGGKMPRFFSSDYEIFVILSQAPMLSENSPVYKNGVEIGRVTQIQLVEDDRKVEITTRINGNIKVYTNEECRLSLNLLGQSSLNFTPKPDVSLGTPLVRGNRIEGITPIDLLQVADTMQSDLSRALQNISAAAEQMSAGFGKINQMIGPPDELAKKQERLEQIVEQAAETMVSVNSVLKSVNELISDPAVKQGIKTSSTQLPGVIEEGKTLMRNINTMTGDVASVLKRVNTTITKVDGNLDNITSFTESLGSDGPQFLESMAEVAAEFEVAAAQLADFTKALNNPDSSLGQLINDPEFFRSINSTVKKAEQTVKNIERITVQLQPILKDVNVMSDKLARDPWSLGLKGLLDKSPPTKGTPDAYAGFWGTRNNGIPQRQSERIMWQRTPHSKLFPLGQQQFRNEPIPQQSRYASQVIDLPDDMPYDTMSEYYETSVDDAYPNNESWNELPLVAPGTYPLGAHVPTQPNRVRIIPLQQVAAVQASPMAALPSQESRGNLVFEIDFENETEPPLQSPQPLRLATGHVPSNTRDFQKIVPASGVMPVQNVNQSKSEIPDYSPVF